MDFSDKVHAGELLILDSGLHNFGSHSYHFIKQIVASLSKRHLSFHLYGASCIEDCIAKELNAIPHFHWSLYQHPHVAEPSLKWQPGRLLHGLLDAKRKLAPQREHFTEAEIAHFLNGEYRKDLERLPAGTWHPENILLIPGISQFQIDGLISHLLALPADRRPTVICQLMLPPNWTPWGDVSTAGERLFKRVIAKAAPLIDTHLFFTTDNDFQHHLFQRQFKIGSYRLPLPYAVPIADTKPPCGERPLKAGFFGYAKMDKGFQLLPQAIALCQQKRLNVEFVVQVQHTAWQPDIVTAEEQLRRLSGVKILEGVLNSEDYYREMEQVDFLLLPYDPAVYGSRGSAIYTEAACAGRPVVATRGTSLGQGVQSGEAEGELFAIYTGIGLAEAIERLVQHFPERRAAAMRKATSFAAEHSADCYVDAVINIGKLAMPQHCYS